MDNLRKYLKEHKNVWVKISRWRGDFETLQSKNYDYISLKLDEIEHELGAWANQMEFICEEDLPDKVEVGYDGYCINGQFPTKTMFGIEIKDLGYLGVMKEYKDLPEPVINFNTKIAPLMKSYKYKNFYSSEIRVGTDKKGYMIDSCNRCGSPPNELYQEMFTNISDIIWEGAHDKCIDPIPKAKFGAEVLIHCPWAEKNWLPIQFPEKYYDSIKFRDVMDIKGQHYIIPQYVGLPEIGAIVATGNTIEETFKTIEEIAETVRGYYVDVPLHALDTAMEEVNKLKKLGYDVFK